MEAQRETHDRALIGVVVSDGLYRDDMGYCLIITRHAIIGAEKAESAGEFQAYLGPGADLSDEKRGEAEALSERLVGEKKLFIPIGSIGQVLFKRPGLFFGGYVIVKTGASSYKIELRLLSVGGQGVLDASETLMNSLREAVGERLVNVEGLMNLEHWLGY